MGRLSPSPGKVHVLPGGGCLSAQNFANSSLMEVPIRDFHWACVISHLPSQKPLEIVTLVCGPSSARRFCSVTGLPMVNSPGAIQTISIPAVGTV